MSTLTRLIGFAALLALVFAAAAFAGSRIDVRPGETTEDDAAGGHGGDAMPVAQTVRGLAVSDDGLTLRLERRTAPLGRRFDLRFAIRDARGAVVRDFDVEHTKRMHVVVVRRDMTGFQHLHPTQQPDGSWSVPVTLDTAGSYRVFADFSVDERPRTLADELTVDGAVRSRPLPAATTTAEVDGLRVRLDAPAADSGDEADLGFTVTRRDGTPVAVEDYLGAKGHLVALRDGDLAFLHVHPDEDRLRFAAEFPTAGRYRLFLQFKTDGRVHTAAFTREVAR